SVLRDELTGVDDKLSVDCSPSELSWVMAAAEQAIWLASLHAAPHGVKRMSVQVPGVAETSNNLGVIELGPDGGHCNFMVRFLVDSSGHAFADEIVSLFSLSGTVAEKGGYYPGWTPNPGSPLLALCQSVYRRCFGADAATQVIHAGLECGIIAGKYPGMDIVSFGPTIRSPHAPGEAVEIASVERCWQLLREILAAPKTGLA
ncbi:MAG: cytosol nonspecific dipeptidase, partial [Propionivibrio sp.]